MKILITEDERLIAEDLKFTLQKQGVHVVGIVSNGEDAIELCDSTKPDMVIMDIMLDGDMNGIEAARRINDKYQIPILYMSANSDRKTIYEANKIENLGFIIKPFDDNILHELIFKAQTTLNLAY